MSIVLTLGVVTFVVLPGGAKAQEKDNSAAFDQTSPAPPLSTLRADLAQTQALTQAQARKLAETPVLDQTSPATPLSTTGKDAAQTQVLARELAETPPIVNPPTVPLPSVRRHKLVKETEPARLYVGTTVGARGSLGFKEPSLDYSVLYAKPVKEHYEFQAGGLYSPDKKAITNDGHGAQFRGSVIYWTSHVGFVGGVRRSWLWTSQFNKRSLTYTPGVVLRYSGLDTGQRIYLYYTFEPSSYDKKTGIEGSRMRGIEMNWEGSLYNIGRIGLYEHINIGVYHFWEQGNPACDGTLGPVVPGCQRQGRWGFGTMVGFSLVFPKPRDPSAAY